MLWDLLRIMDDLVWWLAVYLNSYTHQQQGLATGDLETWGVILPRSQGSNRRSIFSEAIWIIFDLRAWDEVAAESLLHPKPSSLSQESRSSKLKANFDSWNKAPLSS